MRSRTLITAVLAAAAGALAAHTWHQQQPSLCACMFDPGVENAVAEALGLTAPPPLRVIHGHVATVTPLAGRRHHNNGGGAA